MGLAFEMGFLVEEYVFIDFERKNVHPVDSHCFKKLVPTKSDSSVVTCALDVWSGSEVFFRASA